MEDLERAVPLMQQRSLEARLPQGGFSCALKGAAVVVVALVQERTILSCTHGHAC